MLYITYCDLRKTNLMGIRKKVIAQIAAFKKTFGRVYYTCYAGQMLYLLDDGQLVEKEVAVTRKDCNQILSHWVIKYNIMRTYIRYNRTDRYFLQFLQFLKEKKIKTVLEIPTYPYDAEMNDDYTKMEDIYYREQLGEYVDRIATYSNDGAIWRVPCINLKNGIDIQNIPLNIKKNREENTINLIAVSSMAPWHGYERILEGMYQYYKENGMYKILLRFVGEGGEENYYKSLVEKYNLKPFVMFCGKMTGKELDEKFELSDIAVGSLGMYKTGIFEGNPIKGAEYCARGIPFICGYKDTRFSQEQQFVMHVSNDEQAIDIKAVIHFYEKIVSQKDYQKIMRDYAEKCLTWDSIMKSVIDYYNG